MWMAFLKTVSAVQFNYNLCREIKFQFMKMAIVMFVTNFFKKEKKYSSLFSSAFSEGIKDLFEEMGYSSKTVTKKITIPGLGFQKNKT